MSEKHIPLRMCISCRQMKPQSGLIRVVRENGTGAVLLDRDKKCFGRGAYVCREAECIDKAIKRNGFARHLGRAVPTEIYKSLQEEKKG